MDMQSLLFGFYWQYFKVLLIDVHKGKYNFFVMINDKVGLSTAYSCKHQYSIFSRVLYFSRVTPRCMDYFSLLSPPGFCNCFFIPNKCIRPQPLQIGLPKSPPSALLHPQQLHRHTSAPHVVIFLEKFHHKHSSRRLHK